MLRSVFAFLKNPFHRGTEAMENAGAHSSESFWQNTKKQFKKNRLAVFAMRFLFVLVIIALLADLLANEKPLICKYKGSVYFPVFRSYLVDAGIANWQKDLQNVEWNKLDYEWSVFPPVPYLPKNQDENNSQSVSPFAHQNVPSARWRHWLGTDELGRDILAAMIHGTRIALLVGVVSMSIAAFIGILLGALAGFFGDNRLKISRATAIFGSIFLLLGLFYAFGARSYLLRDALAESFFLFLYELLVSLAIFVFILMVGRLVGAPLKLIPFFAKKINVPVDIIVSRAIEVMLSIPTLFLIISISAIVEKPSIFIVMVIIGATSWTGIARFIRAELLRVRNLEYIEAANALGYSQMRVLFRHAIPNALSPVLIAVAFGVASSILIEATLSFLGVGVPAETLTWGALLSAARQTPTAWWLAIFPGLAIFVTVTIFNLAGEGLTDALDPRLRK
ncbi:MAG TPA: ABC transporter permease [Bacteroidia bacterium]